MKSFYVSIDIEADGPIPGRNSMIQLGAVAFDEEGTELDSFTVNLHDLPEATPDPITMQWWMQPKQRKILAEIQKDKEVPRRAMHRFVSWVRKLGVSRPTAICYPSWDYMWVLWYMNAFGAPNPFGLSCLDIKTLAHAALGLPFRSTVKKRMPREWFEGLPPHTHRAVEDAREQGLLFFKIQQHLVDKETS